MRGSEMNETLYSVVTCRCIRTNGNTCHNLKRSGEKFCDVCKDERLSALDGALRTLTTLLTHLGDVPKHECGLPGYCWFHDKWVEVNAEIDSLMEA